MRHDVRTRALKDLLQPRVQQPPAGAGHAHEEGRASQALQDHESGNRGDDQTQHGAAPERRDVERGQAQPGRTDRDRGIVGTPQRAKDAIVEALGLSDEHEIRHHCEPQQQNDQQQAADEKRQLRSIARARSQMRPQLPSPTLVPDGLSTDRRPT